MTNKEVLNILSGNNQVALLVGIRAGKQKYIEALQTIKQDLDRLEKLEKTVEILKENKITALKLTWDGTWWTIDVPDNKNFYPVVYGKGKEKYDLLKEVFGNDKH